MKILNLSILAIITFLTILFYDSNNVVGMEMCTLGMLLFNIIYSIQNIKKRFIFLAFQITFLSFLLGDNLAVLLEVGEGVFTKVIEEEFNTETQLYIYLLLFISLFGVFIGYSLNERKKISESSAKIEIDSEYITQLRKYSKRFMYFFSIFALSLTIEKAIFVQATGYVEYYTTYTSVLPPFFHRFEALYETSLYLFLATFPRWKECRIPLLLYFLIGLFSLGYGQRNGFVLNTLFLCIYFSIRHLYKVYGDSEVWVNKKRILSLFIAAPFLVFFLYSYGSTRVDSEAKNYNNPINNTLAFFAQQGGSVRIIGYEKDFSDKGIFPKDVPPYTFGYIIDLYQQNALFKALNIYPTYKAQTVDLAMKGHNFGNTITYLYDSRYYFAGMGLGSCYIAEVHHDFGIIGVFIINLIYGLLFSLLYRYALNNTWYLFLCFLTIMNILYAPRSGALLFINNLLAPTFLIFILIIYLLTEKYKKIKLSKLKQN